MEPTPKQQAVSLITRAQRILVVPARPDGDSIGAGLGLYLMLRKLGKEAAICVMDPVSQSHQFLPEITSISVELPGSRDFIITLSHEGTEPEKLTYDFQGGKLNIVITPKAGSYSSEDATFQTGSVKYDLIITVDAPNLVMLGKIFTEHPEIFKEIPVLNIDHHASNSYFGTVNLVDLTATSASEILVSLSEAIGVEVDPDIATCLLTGIVSDTGSFQHANTTPKSLTVAAQLVAAGAKQQDIIKHLFKTKSYATLKLWGQVLSALQYEASIKLVWAGVTAEDIAKNGADVEGLTGLIDELMTSIPGADVVMLLSEREPRVIHGSLRAARGVNAMEIATLLGGGGHPGAAGFKLADMELAEAAQVAIEKITEYQRTRGAVETTAVLQTATEVEKPALDASTQEQKPLIS